MGKNIIGTQVVTQIGLIVRDVQKTAQAYADFFGIDMPPIYETDGYDKSRAELYGQPSDARCRQAFFKVGEHLDIELIEPDEKPSVWREFLETKGEGVQHIAFVVNGMKVIANDLLINEMPLMQKGEYTGGRYAYFDSVDQLKVCIELLEND